MIGEVGPLRLSLRAKIVGPFVLIVALIGTIGTAAVTALVTSESVAEFNGSLLRASLRANDHLSLVEAARLTTLRAAAATTGVPDATTSHDTAALQRLLTPVVANAAIPSLLLHVLDRQGKEVIAVGPDGPAAVPSSGEFVAEPAVTAVLAGRDDAQGAARLPRRSPQHRATSGRARSASSLPSDPLRRCGLDHVGDWFDAGGCDYPPGSTARWRDGGGCCWRPDPASSCRTLRRDRVPGEGLQPHDGRPSGKDPGSGRHLLCRDRGARPRHRRARPLHLRTFGQGCCLQPGDRRRARLSARQAGGLAPVSTAARHRKDRDRRPHFAQGRRPQLSRGKTNA